MKLDLDRKTQKLIEERMRDGRYDSPEDVVRAALGSLISQEQFGDFAPGELDRLLEEGEESIRRHGTQDGKAVFKKLRQRHLKARGKPK
jgi:Arc/MetJ-type ribon-helix-helix transcriptional regulator